MEQVVVLAGKGSSLLGACTYSCKGQRILLDVSHPLVGSAIEATSGSGTLLVAVDIKSEEETEEGFLVVLSALDERSL